MGQSTAGGYGMGTQSRLSMNRMNSRQQSVSMANGNAYPVYSPSAASHQPSFNRFNSNFDNQFNSFKNIEHQKRLSDLNFNSKRMSNISFSASGYGKRYSNASALTAAPSGIIMHDVYSPETPRGLDEPITPSSAYGGSAKGFRQGSFSV